MLRQSWNYRFYLNSLMKYNMCNPCRTKDGELRVWKPIFLHTDMIVNPVCPLPLNNSVVIWFKTPNRLKRLDLVQASHNTAHAWTQIKYWLKQFCFYFLCFFVRKISTSVIILRFCQNNNLFLSASSKGDRDVLFGFESVSDIEIFPTC